MSHSHESLPAFSSTSSSLNPSHTDAATATSPARRSFTLHSFSRSTVLVMADQAVTVATRTEEVVSVQAPKGKDAEVADKNLAAKSDAGASAAAASSSPPAPSAFASLYLSRPVDDFHVHLRDGPDVLESVLRHMLTRPSAGPFAPAMLARALVMPNLNPPVTNAEEAMSYRQRILTALDSFEKKRQIAWRDHPDAHTTLLPLDFDPLMSLYLTDATTPEIITAAKATGVVYACKLYPKGATTHSNAGVTDIMALLPVFRTMAENDLLLLVHGESTDPAVDIFDRESAFLPVIQSILSQVPKLRVVLEHVSTAAGVRFVAEKSRAGARIAATLTAHHLGLNRNALFDGGLNPSVFCLPILKAEADRLALLDAVFGIDEASKAAAAAAPAAAPVAAAGASSSSTDAPLSFPSSSCSPYLFAGTDSAPHPRSAKEKCCGCAAGCFTAHASVELYAEAFEAHALLRGIPTSQWHRRLERFLTEDGALFYGLRQNLPREIMLRRQEWSVPETMEFGSQQIVPVRAGKKIQWSVQPSA